MTVRGIRNRGAPPDLQTREEYCRAIDTWQTWVWPRLLLAGGTWARRRWQQSAPKSLNGLLWSSRDDNHSTNFVDPVSGTHTNGIEGTWNHVKNRALRRGWRRTADSLDAYLTNFMWLRQKQLTSGQDKQRLRFAKELPLQLNWASLIELTLVMVITCQSFK